MQSKPTSGGEGGAASAASAAGQTLLEHLECIKKPLGKLLPDKLALLHPRRILKGHVAKIYGLCWSPADPSTLISVSQDGSLKVWNAAQATKAHSVPLRSAWVMTCALSPSGRLAASAGLDNIVTLTRLDGPSSHTAAGELAGHTGYVSCVTFHSDDMLISSSGDNTCALWSVHTKQQLHSFAGHTGDVMAVAVGPSPHIFVSVGCDRVAQVWDLRTKAAALTLTNVHASDVNTCTFFPDGAAFFTGGDDGACHLFDVRAAQPLATYALPAGGDNVSGVAVSHTGRTLFATSTSGVFAWEVQNPNASRLLWQPESRASCLGVNCDGSMLAAGSWDTLLKVFME